MWKYYQSTSKTRVKVIHNLIVWGKKQGADWVPQARSVMALLAVLEKVCVAPWMQRPHLLTMRLGIAAKVPAKRMLVYRTTHGIADHV